ncbi:MAG: DUF4262 domain-containing protein [Alphaproteobacteria bacterium]|nr:DUF4262 domain-containing protein [Alphaproteobacteria bacterium]
MLTALDAPEEVLDEDEREFVAQIRTHGWFGTHIYAEGDASGFSFTTGFCVTLNHPEVIVFGLDGEIAHDVLWDVFRDVRDGRPLRAGVRLDGVLADLPIYVFPVDVRHYEDHLGWSRWFYAGDAFPCLQLVWPDAAGVFPWEPEFTPEFVGLQPDLTTHGWRAALAL